MRNLYLYRHENTSNKPIVQLNAHTDEVGFMVKAIRPDGMIEFITIGGWIPTNVPAHMVRIRNKDGVYVPAVVASKPPHFMSEAEKKAPLEITNLVLDVGAVSSEEVINDYRIGIAAPVVPDVTCTYDEKHGLFIGKAFDCRIGCASTLATLKELQGTNLKVNLVGDFFSQEEWDARPMSVQPIKAYLATSLKGVLQTIRSTCLPSANLPEKGPMLRHMITHDHQPTFQR